MLCSNLKDYEIRIIFFFQICFIKLDKHPKGQYKETTQFINTKLITSSQCNLFWNVFFSLLIFLYTYTGKKMCFETPKVAATRLQPFMEFANTKSWCFETQTTEIPISYTSVSKHQMGGLKSPSMVFVKTIYEVSKNHLWSF